MDFFGIGQSLQGVMQAYFQGYRATGKTTRLLQSLKDGDRIITNSQTSARHLRDQCRMRGLKVEVVLYEPRQLHKIFGEIGGTSQGRTLFDHTFVEEHYRLALKEAEGRLAYYERELSGFGEAHLKTQQEAKVRAAWFPVL